MFQLFEYELPFRSLFRTGSSEFENRKGVLLHYREDDIDFAVEASPLPGFSNETLSEVRHTLMTQKKQIERFLSGQFSIQDIRRLTRIEEIDLPSVQFSLSFLSLSILAQRKKKTLFDLFGKQPPHKIPVNDVIGNASIQEMQNQSKTSIQQGFSVLKIKAPHPIVEQLSLFDSIYQNHPDIQFRIDANQSWPKSELENNCEKLRHLPVEYIEEPCKINNRNDIKVIQTKSSIPIALDESITSIEKLKKVLKQFPDLTIVIKPMLLGNFLELYETISQFRSCFKKIVVTTTLESTIGRSMIASVASLIGDPQMSHGLHTGYLFADDLLPDFKIQNGSIINFLQNPVSESFRHIKTSYLKKLV